MNNAGREFAVFANHGTSDAVISFYRIHLLTWRAVYNTLNGDEFSLLNPRALSRRGECLKAARYSPVARKFLHSDYFKPLPA